MKKNLLFLVLLFSSVAVFAQKTLFTENFEGAKLPAGWKIESKATDGGWRFGKIAAMKSSGLSFAGNTTNFACANDDKADQDHSNDLLISPKMNLAGANAVFFSAKFFYGKRTDQGIDEATYVLASNDAGQSWNEVGEVERSLNEAGDALVWTTQTFDLSAYKKDTAVWVAIKFTDNDGYLYGVGVDDVSVFEPAAVAATMKAVTPKRYGLKADGEEVKAIIANNGASPITSVELTYKVDGGNYTKTITGLNIAPFKKEEVAHPDKFKYPATGSYTFDVSMSKVNDVAIAGAGTFKKIIISKNEQRKVVYEEGTGTWCGWCPRGAVFMDSMAQELKKDFIGIAVHNGANDPMKVTIYDAGLTKVPGFSGFPGVVVDRAQVIDPAEMFDVYDAARAELNPFSLKQTVTYDSLTRTIKVTLKTKATASIKGSDYRFNVAVIEDGVKGLASGYAQVNYYSASQANADLIFGNTNWKDLPSPVPAKDMVYNHTARAILGTFAGKAGSIPADINEGEEYTTEFSYVHTAVMNPKKMKVVGMIIDAQGGGVIMNGEQSNVISASSVGVKDILDNNAVSVYPNPMNDQALIEVTTAENTDVSVRVLNMVGQVMTSRDFGKMSGTNYLPLLAAEYPNGVYTVQVKMGEKMAVKKITIQH
jgi:thiol-disulfide isomerase/thioredoxin